MEKRKEAIKDFWGKAEIRRKLYLDRVEKSKEPTAEALYSLCAELCCLEQLMVVSVFKP